MAKKRKKLLDRYHTLFNYHSKYYPDYGTIFDIPENENFHDHYLNIIRLLEVEFGGFYKIEFWDERECWVETNIPFSIYQGDISRDEDLTDEQNDKLEEWRRYRHIGESTIERLW